MSGLNVAYMQILSLMTSSESSGYLVDCFLLLLLLLLMMLMMLAPVPSINSTPFLLAL